MWKKTELLPSFIGLSLVGVFGLGLDGLLHATERQWFPVVPLALVAGVDQSYLGHHHLDPPFAALLERMPRMRRQALAAAQARSGLVTDDPDGFVVRFVDSADYGAASQPVRAEQRDVFLVSLAADQAVLGVMDVYASLVHEFIHCLMRERMGDRAYRSLPAWFREGAAVWGAGQLLERMHNLVADAFLAGQEPGSKPDWQRAWPGLRDPYLRDAMGFEWLAQTRGEAAVRALIARVVEGATPDEAFSQAAGLAWAELERRRDRFAAEHFERLVESSGLAEFQRARRLHGQGKLLGALGWLHRLVDERADSLLVAVAWYWIGRISEEAGRDDWALAAYQAVLDRFGHQLGLQEDSRLRLTECLLRMGEPALAAIEAQAFLDHHPRASRTDALWARQLLARALTATQGPP